MEIRKEKLKEVNKKSLSTKSTLKFEAFASYITKFVGTASAFSIAFIIILIWGSSGPFFHFSETWQIVINTATTIVTFLMVFLIQHSQNKGNASIQIKLDELIDALETADKNIINIEELSAEELKVLKKYYEKLGIKFTKPEITIVEMEKKKEEKYNKEEGNVK